MHLARRVYLACLFLGLGLPVQAKGADEPDERDKPIVFADFEAPDETGLQDLLVRNAFLDVVDDEGTDGGKALRTKYEGYERGSKRVTAQFVLPEKLTEATLNYDVKFGKAFQFVLGGKLHGLAPDKSITGGKPMQADGWSARVMWRGTKGLNTYVYSQNKEGQYGEETDRVRTFTFKPDRYYSVTLYVKLNDPVDKANGSVRIYVNGKGVADHRNIQFRSKDGENTQITRILFNTFHGGQDPSWAPKDKEGKYADVYAYFDNFAVYKGLHVRKKPGQP